MVEMIELILAVVGVIAAAGWAVARYTDWFKATPPGRDSRRLPRRHGGRLPHLGGRLGGRPGPLPGRLEGTQRVNRLLGIVAGLLVLVVALPTLAELVRAAVPALASLLVFLTIVRLLLPPRRRH